MLLDYIQDIQDNKNISIILCSKKKTLQKYAKLSNPPRIKEPLLLHRLLPLSFLM